MLHAQLRGKLGREQENMEDILTSNVFGTLSYVPVDVGLVPFLRCVEGVRADQLRDLLDAVTRAEYEFWPRWSNPGCKGCEPDVVIRLFGEHGQCAIVLLEAKYLSGKSSEANEETKASESPNDQLAREWDNLRMVSLRERVPAFLVYVTAHYARPRSDIEASEHELVQLRGDRGAILWLPWRALVHAIESDVLPMLADLRLLMRERYQLAFFDGIQISRDRSNWRFVGSPAIPAVRAFAWSAVRLGWVFDAASQEPITTFDWRFNYSRSWKGLA